MYNNSNTVGETIESLVNQEFEHWNCVITDDSADEKSFSAAKAAIAADSRFTLIRNDRRLGAAENWNKTLSLATGEYFKLLCADDILAPHALRQQLQALENNPRAVLCTGRRDIINSSGRILIRNRGLKGNLEVLDARQATKLFIRKGANLFGEPSFALFRTGAIRELGGFSDSWSYLIDVEAYLRCLSAGALVPLNENLGSFRISTNSWSSTLLKEQRSETLRFINHTIALSSGDVSRVQSTLGKFKAIVHTYFRRIIFLFS